MFTDLRFAIRLLLRSPGFAVVAVLVLALGIGANTAIFTVVDSVLLRPLPYPQADRIVTLGRSYKDTPYNAVISAAKYKFWSEQSQSFESTAVVDVFGSGVNLSGSGEAERVPSERVSAGFFRVLEVQPALGRTFTQQEDQPGGSCVAVVTDRLWRSRLGADSGILSKSQMIDGESCAIVGVLPPRFQFAIDADVFLPIRIARVPRSQENAYRMIARLKSGVSIDQARAEMRTVFSHFATANPDLAGNTEVGIRVQPYLDWIVGDARLSLWMLMGSVALVLLIACANIANLLLARATGRIKEMAVRTAVGATRSRLARQLIAESMLLALGGGIAGVLLAQVSVPILLHFAPADLPRAADITVDARVMAFALLLSVLTGLIFGLLPALRSSRVNLNESLKEGSRSSFGAGRTHARSVLIAAEVALSVILLAGALLLMRSFIALRNVPFGFDPHGVVTFRMSPGPRYSTTAALWNFERQALEHVRAIPGVEAAATAMSTPFAPVADTDVDILGRPTPTAVDARYMSASPDYFRALRIPLIGGRVFNDDDQQSSTPVAVINEAMARRAFQDRNPVGERISIHAMGAARLTPRTIVGVVGDVRENTLDSRASMYVYIPRSQAPDGLTARMNLLIPSVWVVRFAFPTAQAAESVRKAALSVDAQQPLSVPQTMDQAVSADTARQRFDLLLMTIFASLALLLAVVGIYGVVSYQVGQRSREIAIRIALGASRAGILRMVIVQGMIPIAAGIVAGIAASFALTRLIQSLLYHVSARDPLTMILMPLILAAVALAACYAPARRAATLDPMIALRQE